MNYSWLEDYCLSKRGAEKEYKAEWEAIRYLVGGKMFGLQGNDSDGRSIITLKLNPVYGELLRNTYPDIRPGYYMNKTHWNSLDLNGHVPGDVLKSMVDQSYDLIFKSLTKQQRSNILCTFEEQV